MVQPRLNGPNVQSDLFQPISAINRTRKRGFLMMNDDEISSRIDSFRPSRNSFSSLLFVSVVQ